MPREVRRGPNRPSAQANRRRHPPAAAQARPQPAQRQGQDKATAGNHLGGREWRARDSARNALRYSCSARPRVRYPSQDEAKAAGSEAAFSAIKRRLKQVLGSNDIDLLNSDTAAHVGRALTTFGGARVDFEQYIERGLRVVRGDHRDGSACSVVGTSGDHSLEKWKWQKMLSFRDLPSFVAPQSSTFYLDRKVRRGLLSLVLGQRTEANLYEKSRPCYIVEAREP